MKSDLKHIELFAGCGGMSLGLEAAGFELYFANELSPMAGETFAYNILDENLSLLAEKEGQAEKTLWVKSMYQRKDLKERLREKPADIDSRGYSDLNSKTELQKKILIGNINDLLVFLRENESIFNNLREQNIDLVSGGPPCQSFSLAGKREKDNKKNLLPLSFAQFAGMVQPKMILLENVKGITSPFTIDGVKFYAWVEVAKAFCLEGFVPICMMLNSKYFGIPQNRPRFILLALRFDIFSILQTKFEDEANSEILANSIYFYKKVIENKDVLYNITKKDIQLYDIEKVPELFNGDLLPKIVTQKGRFISAKDAIDDLSSFDIITKSKIHSEYVIKLNAFLSNTEKNLNWDEKVNHEIRKHGFKVKARFRWCQIISKLNGLSPFALKILSGQVIDDEKMAAIFQMVKGEQIIIKDGQSEKFETINSYESFLSYINSIRSKKHSQRAINEFEPAPAQLTIPDDLCHYSPNQLRTLTVREMARFQSFPDWFEFKSKVTTGGTSRSYEVPQYTQVGNAVPPLLAYNLGSLLKNILIKVNDVK